MLSIKDICGGEPDMDISPSYLAEIKRFEGFTPAAKWDYAQYSNGYGTVARHPGEVISVEEAERRFRGEIGKSYEIVQKFAPQVDDGTKAALTSLTYNAGTAWMKSGLGSAIRSGDIAKARELFVQYVNAGGEKLPGLVARRTAEVEWIGNAIGKLDGQAVAANASPAVTATAASTPSEQGVQAVAVLRQQLAQLPPATTQPGAHASEAKGGATGASGLLETLAVTYLREAQIAMMAFDASEKLRESEEADERKPDNRSSGVA
ncbi:MAG: lysozyme [Pseudomonadota bacterium]